jgi:sugar fermentation stimulation protein A
MDFPELVYGRLIKRYKRFLADVRLDTGEEVTAHCANPGSMKSVLEPPPRVWLSRARAGRKLPFTWEVAELGDTRVYVNPVGANRVVTDALGTGLVEELRGYDLIHPEVKYGTGSRIDFLLTGSPGLAYVEVKNVTLGLGGGRSAFPDSVTARGTKHLLELQKVVEQGNRGVLVFCVSRTDATSVEAAREIDATYAETLSAVAARGVEVLAYGGEIDVRGFRLTRRVPVRL